MAWILGISLFLSTINLYLHFKNMSRKPFQHDIDEFQKNTESIMVEFNRITTRNIELLDTRIEELSHKIRLSQKIDLILKERFEEAHKIEFLKPLQLNEVYNEKKIESFLESEKNPYVNFEQSLDNQKDEVITNAAFDNSQETPEINNITIPSILENFVEQEELLEPQTTTSEIPMLFEGIPIEKLKKTQSKSSSRNKKQELLQTAIREKKNKEELLQMGFTSNEINLAYLCYANEESNEQ